MNIQTFAFSAKGTEVIITNIALSEPTILFVNTNK